MELEAITRFLSGYDNALLAAFSFYFDNYIRRIHHQYSARGLREVEVQRSHVGSTPRIGGIAILVGCVYAWYNSDNFSSNYLGYIICLEYPFSYLAC